MAKKDIRESLKSLEIKKAQLEAQIQSKKSKITDDDRKLNTRRKILIGAYVLDKHVKSETYGSLVEELDKFLSKAHDRAVFGLLPREDSSEVKSKSIKE